MITSWQRDNVPASDLRTRPAIVGMLTVLTVRLGVAFAMTVPIVQPDEGAHLGIAHYLAHGSGLPASSAPYNPGLGVVLTPFSWLFPEPLGLYRCALVVNALLGVVAFVFMVSLARRLAPERSHTQRVAAAAIVALAPALVSSSGLANVSSLFVAGSLGVALLVARAWEADRVRRWAVVGAAAGALTAVHPTATPLAIGVFIGACFGLARDRDRSAIRVARRRMFGLAVGAGPVVIASLILATRVRDATPVVLSGQTNSRLGQAAGLVGTALSRHHVSGLVAETAGQFLYLTASTASLFLIGMMAGLASFRAALRSPQASIGVLIRAYAAAVSLVTIIASVFVINPPDNSPLESYLYGRYNEHVFALVVLIGLVNCLSPRNDRTLWTRPRTLGVVGIALTGAFIAIVAGRPGNQLEQRQDVLGLAAPFYALEKLGHITLPWVTAVMVTCGVGGWVAIAVATRSGGPWAVLGVATFTTLTLAAPGVVILAKGSTARSLEHNLAPRIVAAAADAPDHCVGYSGELAADWHLFNYQFLLPTQRFKIVLDAAPTKDAQICRNALLAGSNDPLPKALGLTEVAREHTTALPDVVLYARPNSGN